MIEVEEIKAEDTVWGDQPPGGALVPAGRTPVEETGPVRVGHVVDFYRRYPGDLVTFFTLVEIFEPESDLVLRVSIPQGLELTDYYGPEGWAGAMPYIESANGTYYLVWTLEGDLPTGTGYEFRALARVAPIRWVNHFESRASVTNRFKEMVSDEFVTVRVEPKGGYLRHLPELYEQDEMMGRFLMLFESFWTPIETQIDSVANYFDPRLTPAQFLPWLASWLDLDLDESWPEARIRRLIRWAIALHRSRGTKWGVLKYLEIYTGQRAKIIEGRAKNFILGPDALLGPGVALGTGNRPHTFTVELQLPPMEAESDAEQERLEKLRERTITSIIEMQKPAHTVYTLDLKIVSAADLAAQAEQEADTEPDEKEDEIAAQAATWFKLDEDPPVEKSS